MSLATAAAIRDRIHTLVEALTPTSHSGDKFRRWRNEGNGDFVEAMEKNPAGCLRRFQAREIGTDEIPETSSGIEERVRLRFELRISYPQTGRFGSDNSLDRDDVVNQDWSKINYTIGIYGAGNFSGVYDCIPLGATKSRESGVGVDFLLLDISFEFLRSVA